MGKSHAAPEEHRTAIHIKENGKQVYLYERIEKTGNGVTTVLHNETGERPSWLTKILLP